MKILNSLLRNLGFKDDEEIKSYRPVNTLPVSNQKQNITQTKNFVTIKPKTFSDIERAVDALCNCECSIIDLSDIKYTETVRIIDFLSGATYSLKAELRRLQGDLYLLLPSDVKLNNLV